MRQAVRDRADGTDLLGGVIQLGVGELRGNIIFLGECEQPAESKRFLEERQNRIEWLLPVRDRKRNLRRETRSDVVVGAHTERVEAQCLFAFPGDRNDDREADDLIGLLVR